MGISGILWKLFRNQKPLCPTQFGLVWDHCGLTVTEYCCLQLDLLLPLHAMNPPPAPSSAQEAIPIPYLTHKNEKNLRAVLAWVVVFSSNGGEEASAWDSYFSQRRGHLYFVQAWVKSLNMYATSCLQQRCLLLLCLPCRLILRFQFVESCCPLDVP